MRVTFWSALAMALTAGVGTLFGVVVYRLKITFLFNTTVAIRKMAY